MTDSFIIRKSIAEDIPVLTEIENECILNPWSLASFNSQFSARGSIFLTALDNNNEICGFITASSVLDEVSINNVAVRVSYRRKGVAEMLMNTLYDTVLETAAFIMLEVRESNNPAQKLYKKLGYEYVGVRKNFYTAPVENALLMTKNLL